WLEHHDALFRHSGHNNQIDAAHDQAWIPVARTLVPRGMTPTTEYPTLFSGIDIGIVPLADVPFNHAKSRIKGMEYAAAGVPFAADHKRGVEIIADGVQSELERLLGNRLEVVEVVGEEYVIAQPSSAVGWEAGWASQELATNSPGRRLYLRATPAIEVSQLKIN